MGQKRRYPTVLYLDEASTGVDGDMSYILLETDADKEDYLSARDMDEAEVVEYQLVGRKRLVETRKFEFLNVK